LSNWRSGATITDRTDLSAEPYTRQETLCQEFATVLEELVIPPAILEWLGDAVLTSDRTEQAARQEKIRKLQVRYNQIEARIGTLCRDRLEGRITVDFFDKQAAMLRNEQESLLGKIQKVQKATPEPVNEAIASPDEPGQRVIPRATRRRATPVPSYGCGKGHLEGRVAAGNAVRTISNSEAFEPSK
jgi:hypothetical protein